MTEYMHTLHLLLLGLECPYLFPIAIPRDRNSAKGLNIGTGPNHFGIADHAEVDMSVLCDDEFRLWSATVGAAGDYVSFRFLQQRDLHTRRSCRRITLIMQH